MRIALVGNPNSGKTTLFNSLTGSNQRVGNWPGVTVEKKVGKLKIDKTVEIIDLPGIYSLSPYTLEEEVARNDLLDQKPDAIINIIDGTNLERNLYLSSQLLELNIPLILAVNMGDIIEKSGDKFDLKKLQKNLQLPVVQISALTGKNVDLLAKMASQTAKSEISEILEQQPLRFSKDLEECLEKIYLTIKPSLENIDSNLERWYQIKLFERDELMQKRLKLDDSILEKINKIIDDFEEQKDDDSEGIIATERYNKISKIADGVYEKKDQQLFSISDRIDQIVTNRVFALPIFMVIMFFVYFISVSTIGSIGTDWANDGLFGKGWFLLGQGRTNYEDELEEYENNQIFIETFEDAAAKENLDPNDATNLTVDALLYDDDGNLDTKVNVDYQLYQGAIREEEPDPNNFGIWIDGLPILIANGLQKLNVSTWLNDLVIDGIVAGVGAVLGFVPQLFVLFLCLAFLESVGYMARIALIMDRFFRRFGLSGKSFIPLMIGTGCSVPGIMASRTIENERDRRMTIITTSFIPCGAKLPVIALIAGAFFGGSGLITTLSYFIGIFGVIISGIILKKTKPFAGEIMPFVIELPAYRLPRLRDLLKNAFERSWAFVKGAGSVILLTTIAIWFMSSFGFENGFGQVQMVENSILARIGNFVGVLFIPLGFGDWQASVATITGLVAKENIVGTFGVLFGTQDVAGNGWQLWQAMQAHFTQISAFSFLIFNLLCAPCFATIGAIKREMANLGWTTFAVAYQTILAYSMSFIFYQFALFAQSQNNLLGFIIALAVLAVFIYLLFRPDPNHDLSKKEKSYV